MTRPSAVPELAVLIPALSERENLELRPPALREVPVIEDPSLRLRLGQAGAARVKQEFSVERYVARILDVYARAKSRAG